MSYITRHEVVTAILGHISGDVTRTFKPKQLRPYLDCSPTAIAQHLQRMLLDGEAERVSMGVYRLLPSPVALLPVEVTEPEVVEPEVVEPEVAEVAEPIRLIHLLHEAHVSKMEAIRRSADDLILEEKLRFADEVSRLCRGDA